MTEPSKQNTAFLRVKMFGGFGMTYDGAPRSSRGLGETQFSQLMQILIHYREHGVSRAVLEEALFADRELEDVHHALQSVIYNAKKKLAGMGLPKVNYISLRQGNFYWTDEIPVEEDAARFDALYQAAEAAKTENEALAHYLDACYCYAGEFLPMSAGALWAAKESRRYRLQFYDCVEKAAAILRKKQDYLRMEALGVHAAKVAPFADWETVTMEALVAMGRAEEASRLYTETVDLYFREQGLAPSKALLESLKKLSAQIKHGHALLDEIQKRLAETDECQGGYLCTFPEFQGIYHMIRRMMGRNGLTAHLMLCTVMDSKGAPMKPGAILDNLSTRLGEAIRRSVRLGDAVNQYSKGQFLVLLVNTTMENCSIITRRIDDNFIQGRQRTGVDYRVNTVLSLIEWEK